MSNFKAIVIILCLTTLWRHGSAFLTSTQKIYNEINDYLVRHAGSKGANENLKVAGEWLNSLSKVKDKQLVEILESFIALSDVDQKCTQKSLDILDENARATNAFANRYQSKEGPNRRIENVIYQIATRHALDCQDDYQETYDNLKENLDEEQTDRVWTSFASLFGVTIAGFKRPKIPTHPLKIYTIYGGLIEVTLRIKNWNFLYEPLLIMANQNNDKDKHCLMMVDGKSKKVENSKIERLLNEYIVEPCQYFTNEYAKVFVPAKQDSKWGWNMEFSEEALDYYRSWGCFRVCQSLLRNRSTVLKEILSIVAEQKIQNQILSKI